MRAQQSDRTAKQGVALAMRAFERLGFAFREQSVSDYGIDAHAELIEGDSATGRLLGVQIKSGQSYLSKSVGDSYVFRADAKHVGYWVNHALPVLVCLADLDNDAVYWQVINNDTAESTGTNYRLMIPKDQMLNEHSLPALRDMLTMVIPRDRYTLLNLEDVSHVTAKRYSCKAVLNGTFSKAEIGSIIRQMTTEGAGRRYYRNHLVERRWGDSDAEVVWVYIYASMNDYANNNVYCRSLWINPSLLKRDRPTTFQGENIGDGTIVDWNSNHDLLADLLSKQESTKEEYLKAATPLIAELEALILYFQQALPSPERQQLARSAFVRRSQTQIQQAGCIYGEVNDLPGAPYECKEVDNLMQQVAGNIDNIAILYSDNSKAKWSDKNRLYLASEQVNDAASTMKDLKYELRKIR